MPHSRGKLNYTPSPSVIQAINYFMLQYSFCFIIYFLFCRFLLFYPCISILKYLYHVDINMYVN